LRCGQRRAPAFFWVALRLEVFNGCYLGYFIFWSSCILHCA